MIRLHRKIKGTTMSESKGIHDPLCQKAEDHEYPLYRKVRKSETLY